MKRLVYITAALLLIFSFSGCSAFDEDIPSDNGIRLNAVISSPVLAVKGGEGAVYGKGYGELSLGMARKDVTGNGYPSYTDAVVLAATMSETENGAIDFTDSYQYFRNSKDVVHFASWYPYGDTYSAGKVSFAVDGQTDVMYGSPIKGTKDQGFETIVFNHAMVKFKVWVYAMVPVKESDGTELYDPDELWGTVESLTIADVPDTYTLVLPVEGKYGFEKVFADPVNKRDMTLAVPFGSDAEKPARFPRTFDARKAVAEFIIPEPDAQTLTLKVKTTELSAQEISIVKDFEPGRHYDIVLRFTDHGLINTEVIAGEWNQGADVDSDNGMVYFDLSLNETANCYMVSSANYNYSFNAMVKGNGAEGVVDGTEVSLNPSYVKVLWADAGILAANKDAIGFWLLSDRIAAGKVLFRVNGNQDDSSIPVGHEGNVLLGVYDEDPNVNAAAKPLWTWHIWICDRPQVQGYKNGFKTQDRDLGAIGSSPFNAGTSVTDLDGLYYQWGRPTPLPLGRIDGAVSMGPGSDDPYVSLPERINNPGIFYPQRLDGNVENLKSLWGWRSVSDEYVKTIYDPCPPGYRVPSQRLWDEMTVQGAHINHNGNTHSIHFEIDAHYDIFYPVSGYYDGDMILRNYYNGSGSGAAYMWAATYDESYHNPYNLKYQVNDGVVGNHTVQSTNTSGGLHSYYALPVRCVARRSTPHVEDLSAFQTANSYIVSQKGYYKFKADVRGNGVGRLVSPGSSSFIDVSEGLLTGIPELSKVDFLWWQAPGREASPVVPPVVLDNDGKIDEDGYVMFHIDEYREGNLILAGYDESGKNILWTWHIWITDTPKQMKSHNFTVMDRFLGATSASDTEFEQSLGFFYQWGRKDPFTVGTWYRYNGSSWEEGSFTTTSDDSKKTIPNSVSEPMRFHLGSGSHPAGGALPTGNAITDVQNYDSKENQCISKYNSSTGSEDVRPALWGYSSASGLGKTTTKTMHDPCPPGYCVSFYTVWTNDNGGSYYTYLDGSYFSYSYSSRGNTVEKVQNKGVYVTAATFDKTWYPFAGYLSGKDMSHVGQGSQGRFNTSTPAGKGSRSMYYDASGAGQAVNGYANGVPSSYALSVRCQKQ